MTQDEKFQLKILTTKFDDLCTAISRYEKRNFDQHQAVMDKIDNNAGKVESKFTKSQDDCNTCRGELWSDMNTKVGWVNFKWIVSGIGALIFFAIVAIGGLVLDNKNSIEKYVFAKEIVEEIEEK